VAHGEKCGGYLWEQNLVSFCRLRIDDSASKEVPTHLRNDEPQEVGSNLKHKGIPNHAWAQFPTSPSRSEVLPNLVGKLKDQPVFDESGPLLPDLRVLLQTERGVRQLLPEEWYSLKGLPKKWTLPTRTGLQLLRKQPSVHILSTVGQVLSTLLAPDLQDPQLLGVPDQTFVSIGTDSNPQDPDEWVYQVPDLGINSDLHRLQRYNLELAAQQYGNLQEVIAEGEVLLESHRPNYRPEGPQYLVVLWWELSPLHWEDLRLGASMIFVKIPIPMKEPNSPFT
jgi:hypothetical protein